MLISTLYIITKKWKQPRYLTIGKWKNCDTSMQRILFNNF